MREKWETQGEGGDARKELKERKKERRIENRREERKKERREEKKEERKEKKEEGKGEEGRPCCRRRPEVAGGGRLNPQAQAI